MSAALFIVVSALMSVGLTALVRRQALRHSVLDVPNARSSHTVPTPRGGGLAMIVTFLVCATAFVLYNGRSWQGWLCVVLPSVLVACVGLLDDYRSIAATWRILVHFVAVVLAIAMLGGGVPLPFPSPWNLSWLSLIVTAVCMVWVINAVNFMDGIDGIAAMEASFVLLGLLVISSDWVPSLQYGSVLTELALGSVLGFLPWNWSPAKIFMGDVGSGFLGFVLGAVSLALVRQRTVTVWVPLILLGAFLCDATVTLARRMLRGERWYAPHRIHAYQWLSRRWGHQKVTVAVLLINVFWLAPLAFLAQSKPSLGPWLALTALVPIGAAAIACGAGRPE